MGLTLVICSNVNIQKFYVVNLVMRGYFAFGIQSLANQDSNFWPREAPELIVIWGSESQMENDIELLHLHYMVPIPIVVIDNYAPSPEWMRVWGIAAYKGDLYDSRYLVGFLSQWLSKSSA
jgi:hypothetical protein